MTIVIFDMDGTLIDSKKDITISVNYVRDINHNLPPLTQKYIVDVINMQERELPKLFYNTDSYEKKDATIFEEHYLDQCIQNLYLYEDILKLLQELKKESIKISVATNAPTKFAKKMLHHLGIEEMFDMIVGADMVRNSKPSPEMLELILKDYKFNSQEDSAYMIGDSIKDMKSAESAGIKPIFVKWGFSVDSFNYLTVEKPLEILNYV